MGNLLGSPVTDKETHVGRTPEGLEFGVSSMQGWRVHMEDAHICEPKIYAMEGEVKLDLPGHSLFAVFDGHGGTFAAEYAGLNFLRVLSRQAKFVQYAQFHHQRSAKEPQLSDEERVQYVRAGLDLIEAALRDAFVDLDREIFLAMQGHIDPHANTAYHPPNTPDTAIDQPMSSNSSSTEQDSGTADADPAQPNHPTPNEYEDSGTTVVVVMVTPQWIICANAGDSRAVISKQSNKAIPLSYDHKPDDEEELRRIRAAGGYVTAGARVDGDLAVSRGLGDFRFKVPATVLHGNAPHDEDSNLVKPEDQKVSPIPDIIVQNRSEENDEFIIVACDGIWDVQTNYECVKMIAEIFNDGESDIGLLCEEVVDLCLSLGSKDNMTALVVKFPAQKVGEGGGVKARRHVREPRGQASVSVNEPDETANSSVEQDSTYT